MMSNFNNNIAASDRSSGMYVQTPGVSVNRTRIAGVEPRAVNSDNLPDTYNGGRKIAGILYSVSRDGSGEIFPLYVGRNTIGSEPECDVYLSEDTVSSNHAVLLIRMIPDESGIRRPVASITDYDSDFGTFAGDCCVGFDPCPLRGNEIIRIGNSYSFIFIPLDADKFGLEQSAGFKPVPRKDVNTSGPGYESAGSQSASFYQPAAEEEVYPSAVGVEDENTFYRRSYKQKEDHSSNKTIL